MKINLRFFASVREAVGLASEAIELPDGVRTVGAVRDLLIARGGAWAEALGQGRALRTAVNQQMCAPDTAVTDGGEVAFFPPVTGG
jgi:molybdopterin synthase sulfur carrier subunit